MSAQNLNPTHIKDLPIFAEFTRQELEAFVELADPIMFKVGETIVRQDDPGDCMYVLVSGTVTVTHHRNGKAIELAILQRGDFFGELALVDEAPRSADVKANDNCMLLKVPSSVLRALAGVYPMAALKFFYATARVAVVRMRKANQKYIDTLLVLAKERGDDES